MAIKQKLEVWSDLNPTLVTDSQGKLKLDINIDAVKGSIDNILRTSQGERIMLPEFAFGLKSMLFEPINDRLLNRLSDAVKKSIEIWDDRIIIDEVSFKSDPDYSTITVNLSFRVKSFYETFSHTIVLNP